ncbi:MAG TPA: hypothetical protein DE315_08830 [Candidatus Omnitrophica bacterium]|nr:MAG: hypothetical protein A2Y05_00045 [Omnitrophica WOR_2 bacterium GWA2_53_43]HBO96579.1 hypothetical protein [Candidatus Omnitrophota bacterium]HCI45613.1 hypothetical protein [Candidatus Omnitrophota bacterium]
MEKDIKMNKNIFILCCFFVAGCAFQTLSEPPVLGGKGAGAAQDPRLTRVNSARVGMTSREVAAAMGEKTVIGYERPGVASNAYHPVTVNNPYHKEFLRTADKTCDVFYYFSHIQRADGIISSDELTPLVFENDILIGKGWDFLNKLKNQATTK